MTPLELVASARRAFAAVAANGELEVRVFQLEGLGSFIQITGPGRDPLLVRAPVSCLLPGDGDPANFLGDVAAPNFSKLIDAYIEHKRRRCELCCVNFTDPAGLQLHMLEKHTRTPQ